ncbi:DUF881 domain-containing protein [Clostridium sp. JN-9]|uniref:DUF881 domain-containing protein n=1 Tax=Clostridium sp. JN-9 TaxID=2507159 RepID=UPI000FFE31A3|nr:DUF881 domain-containing protein [Clostridium sp. JN-9]QAT40014.1 DUF881 domain-containing protein [Clostridium sp. JN-9]
MRNNEATVFVFAASIIIGILIAMNINFTRNPTMSFLTAKQYSDAYNEKNRLVKDIDDLRDKYYEYDTKINEIEYGSQKNQVTEEIKTELATNKIVMGTSDVQGPGIQITLNDASSEFMTDEFSYQIRVIHDVDMLNVINDLRSAGAEAISLNGQRIIDRSEITCDGPFLRVNGVKIAAPFYVLAIGEKDVLKNYMMQSDKYMAKLINRKIRVNIVQENSIKISAYTGQLTDDFIKK